MSSTKDFILFDDPRTKLQQPSSLHHSANPREHAAILAHSSKSSSDSSQNGSSSISSFTKHRSPDQSPLTEETKEMSSQDGASDHLSDSQKKRPSPIHQTLLLPSSRSSASSSSSSSSSSSPPSLSPPLSVLLSNGSDRASSGTQLHGNTNSQAQRSSNDLRSLYLERSTYLASQSGADKQYQPRDTPSSSLGPPIHHLSLGETNPCDQLAALDSQKKENLNKVRKTAGAMSPEEQDRVKAQIRSELAGVDSRAFKGPLRDILQRQPDSNEKPNNRGSPFSASADPLQAGVAPSFSLFPDYDVGHSQSSIHGESKSTNGHERPRTDSCSQGSPESQTRQRESSAGDANNYLPSSSYPGNPSSQGFLSDWPQSQQSQSQLPQSQNLPSNPALSSVSLSRNRDDSASRAMPPPSQTIPSHCAQTKSQLYSQDAGTNRSSAGGTNGMQANRRTLKRESSGLTISPKEAFLDFDNVEPTLTHSAGLGKIPSLFAPAPPGLADTMAPEARRGGERGRERERENVREKDDILVDSPNATRSNTPKARPRELPRSQSSEDYLSYNRSRTGKPFPDSWPSQTGKIMSSDPYAHSLSLHRNYQRRSNHSLYQGDGRGNASQESGSQGSIFSPSESIDTMSTDDDEDERPYSSSNMRPSMIRGGPSSLYLNYPSRPLSHSSSYSSTGSNSSRRQSFANERSTSTGSVWGQAHSNHPPHPTPWQHKPIATCQPRFSDVSASSSDSDEERNSRAKGNGSGLAHSRPRATNQSSSEDLEADASHPAALSSRYLGSASNASRSTMPGAIGGYGYIPGSQDSGLSVSAGLLGAHPNFNSRNTNGIDDVSMGESQDDGSQSPSIRSSAQVIDRKRPSPPPSHPAIGTGYRQYSPSNERWKIGQGSSGAKIGPNLSDPYHHYQQPVSLRNDKVEAPGEEEDDEQWDDAEGSDYETNEVGPDGTRIRKRRRKSKASDVKMAALKGSDVASAGHGMSADGIAAPSSHHFYHPPSFAGSGAMGTSRQPPLTSTGKPAAGTTGSTRCDYRSPVTGIICKTAFHRPYDLARHRETIHAREEAGFIREGKLKLEDCVVLGKEVDPKKSMAVVEWKCKTCGASFSRKDAMLRHERLRHSAGK